MEKYFKIFNNWIFKLKNVSSNKAVHYLKNASTPIKNMDTTIFGFFYEFVYEFGTCWITKIQQCSEGNEFHITSTL